MDVLVAKNIQVAETGLIQALKPRFWPVPGVGGGEPRLAVTAWRPHPELNWDQRFRKPLLYPFELWGQIPRCERTYPRRREWQAHLKVTSGECRVTRK
jgi:hypothetical protein